MSFAKVHSAQTSLLDAHIIDIEVDLAKGLHSFSIVGLPDKAVEEARDRMSAAIKNSGYKSPKAKNQKVVISLAPANMRKEGAVFDAALALGYLLASDEVRFDPKGKIFLGELSLDGTLRAVRGALPLVREAKKRGFTEVYVPKDNIREAALIDGISIYGADNLKEIIDHIDKKSRPDEDPQERVRLWRAPQTEVSFDSGPYEIDLSHIKGQETAKRGLEIAAAGGHNVLMWGPPGTGKTMLAKAFRHLLPPLSFEEMLEATSIHSISGTTGGALVVHPPFRAPHHTSSHVSLVGGGATPKPGEITLAHKGVLFLDEFPEFDRRVIDTLREPLEERVVRVSRVKGTATFPAHFILIVAMNPCPCGNYGIEGKTCICSPSDIGRYERKISGPIADRLDIWLEVSKIDHKSLLDAIGSGETTDDVRIRVGKARETSALRYHKLGLPIRSNGELRGKDMIGAVKLAPKVKDTLDQSATKLDLSARAYHRVLKVAQTIADLEGSDEIRDSHVLEALQYRPKKREF